MESEAEKDTGVGEDVEESGLPNWSLHISRVENGYVLATNDTWEVIEDDDKDELKSGEELLWYVMEYFSFYGSKHDPERLKVIRQKNK